LDFCANFTVTHYNPLLFLYSIAFGLSYRDFFKSRYDKQLQLEIPDKAKLFGYNRHFSIQRKVEEKLSYKKYPSLILKNHKKRKIYRFLSQKDYILPRTILSYISSTILLEFDLRFRIE